MEWLREGLGAAGQPHEPRGGGDVKHGRHTGTAVDIGEEQIGVSSSLPATGVHSDDGGDDSAVLL